MRKSILQHSEETGDLHSFAATVCGNRYGEFFSAYVKDAFGEQVKRSTEEQPDEWRMYCHARSKLASGRPPYNSDYQYEEWFHSLYAGDQLTFRKLLFVIGDEGIGKSTFLQYYFEQYLPKYATLSPYAAKLEGDRVNAVTNNPENHTLLSINVAHLTNADDVRETCYDQLRKAIEARYNDIDSHNHYAMWHRKLRKDRDYAQRALRRYTNEDDYWGERADKFIDSDPVFVTEALWYLCSGYGAKQGNNTMVSLLLDDLDQSSFAAQESVLKLIARMLHTADIHLWRVVIPIRPETYSRLEPSHFKLAPKIEFTLGDVDKEKCLSLRVTYVDSAIQAAKAQVYVRENVPTPDGQNFTFCAIESARTSRAQLTRLVNAHYKIEEPHAGGNRTQPSSRFRKRGYPQDLRDAEASESRIQPITRDLISQLAGFSLRRYFWIRQRAAMSKVVEEAIKKSTGADAKIHHYAFLDGVLTGSGFYCQPDSRFVLNVFGLSGNNTSPHGLLVGIHVIHALLTSEQSLNVIRPLLVDIGHSTRDIETVVSALREARLVHYNAKNADVESERSVLNAHIELATEPVFIDNAAIITPVEDSRLQRMSLSVSYKHDHFTKRAETSLAFLEQLMIDENHVITSAQKSARGNAALLQLMLPRMYKRAALKYRYRLASLMEEAPALMRSLPDGLLERYIRLPILNPAASVPDNLQP